jgi:Na+/H+-dicarboxylate symporter
LTATDGKIATGGVMICPFSTGAAKMADARTAGRLVLTAAGLSLRKAVIKVLGSLIVNQYIPYYYLLVGPN